VNVVVNVLITYDVLLRCSTLVAHGAYDWAARHDLHTTANDDLITGDTCCILSNTESVAFLDVFSLF